VTQADDGTTGGAPGPIRAPQPDGPHPPPPGPGQQAPGAWQQAPGAWQQAPGAPPGWRPPPVRPAPDGRPLADFGNRLLAYLLDSVIVGAVAAVIVTPVMSWFMSGWMSQIDAGPEADFSTVFRQILLPALLLELGLIVLIMVVYGVYYVESIYRTGRTLGKKAIGLAVVPSTPGAPMTRKIAIIRFLVQVGGGMIVPLFSYLDGLWQLWDKPYQQTLHDKAAGTVVIKVAP
jgi:uncharacterized RDD family membrane protein YckC